MKLVGDGYRPSDALKYMFWVIQHHSSLQSSSNYPTFIRLAQGEGRLDK